MSLKIGQLRYEVIKDSLAKFCCRVMWQVPPKFCVMKLCALRMSSGALYCQACHHQSRSVSSRPSSTDFATLSVSVTFNTYAEIS